MNGIFENSGSVTEIALISAIFSGCDRDQGGRRPVRGLAAPAECEIRPRRRRLHRRDQSPSLSRPHPHNQSCPISEIRGHNRSLGTQNHPTLSRQPIFHAYGGTWTVSVSVDGGSTWTTIAT